MDSLNFFMIFYGILLGLAVAELFTGLVQLLREPELNRSRVGILVPLFSALLLVDIMSCFIDAWDRMKDVQIELGTMLRPTIIGVGYFVLAAVAVPRPLSATLTLDDYFISMRKRIAALFLITNAVVITYEWDIIHSASVRGEWLSVLIWLMGNVWLTGTYIGIWISRTVWQAAGFLSLAIAFFVVYYTTDPTCLFSENERNTPACEVQSGFKW